MQSHFVVALALLMFAPTTIINQSILVQEQGKTNGDVSLLAIGFQGLKENQTIHFNMARMLKFAIDDNRSIRINFTSSNPVLFSFNKCDEPVFMALQPMSNNIIQLEKPWLEYLFSMARTLCSSDHHDFNIYISINESTTGTILFNLVDKISILEDARTEEKIEIRRNGLRGLTLHSIAINNLVNNAVNSNGAKDLLIFSNITSPIDVRIGKCGIVLNVTFTLSSMETMVIEEDLLAHINRLKHTTCYNFLNFLTFDLFVTSEERSKGDLLFFVETRRDDNIIFAVCIIAVAFVIGSIISCICCRKESPKKKTQVMATSTMWAWDEIEHADRTDKFFAVLEHRV